MFSKTMDLDLKWHLMRKTGEVTRIMDRGTSAIQNVLSTGETYGSCNMVIDEHTDIRNCRNWSDTWKEASEVIRWLASVVLKPLCRDTGWVVIYARW